MTSVSLGPLALPTAPLLVLVAAAVAVWLANGLTWVDPHADDGSHGARRAGITLLHAVYLALAVARVVHVGLNLQAYRDEPWAVLDLRDGGWHAPAGLVAGLGWVAWRAARQATRRRALVAGAAVGCAIWIAGTLGLAWVAPKDLPDLVLTELSSGRPVRLREVAAQRPVVLNLWATWCGPCRKEMPVLAEAQARYPEVVFVFANQGEPAAAVRRYLDAERLRLAVVLLDPGRQLGPAAGSSGLPTTVIYDRQGRWIDAHLGAINGPALAARLKPVLDAAASRSQ